MRTPTPRPHAPTAPRTPHPDPHPDPHRVPRPDPDPAGAAAGAGHGPVLPTAAQRADRLEALLGDPGDPDNPHGRHALLQADDQRQVPAATEELLQRAGLSAEFVPRELGGQLTAGDDLARVLRPVFRRDVALGFGYGVTSLFAASAVWAAGSPGQRRDTARRLLAGGRATILHREIAHANALLRDEFTARPTACGFVLGGGKDVVINAERAEVFVMYARTAAGRGPLSHSVLLLDPARLPPGGLRHGPRVPTAGMRGPRFSGLEFTDCPVGPQALVGQLGQGVQLELRTFQVNRGLILGTAVAGVDSVLRHALGAATDHRPGHRPARRWHRVLAGVFADLLAGDAMALVVLRALTLLPDSSHLPAAAGKYAVPAVLRQDLEELATVLGSRGYDRGPRYGGFQKLLRDLPVAGLGHAGTASCQAVLVPQLPVLARHSWFQDPEPPAALFSPDQPHPGFDYRRLTLTGTHDALAATLVGAGERAAARRARGPVWSALADLAAAFTTELRALRQACATLPDHAAAGSVDPRACALADRYGLVVCAAACLGVHEAHHGTDTFLADPSWTTLALSRLAGRLGLPQPDLPEDVTATVLAEALHRHRHHRSLDLYATHLAG